jgi:hypothetical protein
MVNKKNILGVLTRARLLELAGAIEIRGLTGKAKDDIIGVLVRAGSVSAE